MATPQEIIADPKFLALSPDDRRHVLATVDPNFAALSPADQAHVVISFGGGQPDAAAKARQHLASIAAGTDVPRGAMQPAYGPVVTDRGGNALPIGGTAPGFTDRLKDAATSTKDFVEQMGSGDPVQMLGAGVNLISGQAKELDAASAAAKRPGVGSKFEAAGHLAAGVLPGIGPASAKPAEDFVAGDLGAAAGGATALAAPSALAHVLPPAVRGVAGGARAAGAAVGDAVGPAVRAAGDQLGVPLFDAEGKFTPQAEALVKELHDRGIKITDPKAQATAAAEAIAKQAEDAGVTLKTNKVADMADALPATEPLNAGPRLAKAAVKGAAGAIVSQVPGVGHVAAELTGLSAGLDLAKLAKDFSKTGAIRKWGSNTLAKWGNALRANDAGGLAAAASEGDQAAAGISDPAYGAVSHLGTEDLHAIYAGAPALYVDPDGKTHELNLKQRSSGARSDFARIGQPNENDALLTDPLAAQQLLPERFKTAREARMGSPLHGVIEPVAGDANPKILGLYGADFQPGPDSGHMRYPHGTKQPPDYANTILLSRKSTEGSDPMTDVPLHEMGHAAVDDLTPSEWNTFQSMANADRHDFASRMHANALPKGSPERADFVAKLRAEYPKVLIDSTVNTPDTSDDETFAELFAQYIANPTAFKATYPKWYGYYRGIMGREYIQARPISQRMDLKQVNPS